MDDCQLLHEFARRGSADAFEEIVRRYANFVRMLCHRQIADAQLREDAVQAVFMVLARKAHALKPETVLSGWLIHTARFVCANAMRMELRRLRMERQAMALAGQRVGSDTGVLTAAILDEGLERLSTDERDALLLKVVEGRSLGEIAARMRITEDAAEKRAFRGLEKLKRYFANEKLSLSGGISALLSAGAGCSATEAAALAAAVRAGLHGAAALTKRTIAMLFWNQVKTLALRVAIMAILAVGLFSMVRGGESPPIAKEDLLLSPQQDEATLKKAWQSFVNVDYADTSLVAIAADLSRQSGLEIRVDPACKTRWNGGANVEFYMGLGWGITRARSRTFLSAAEIERVKLASGSIQGGNNAYGSTDPEIKSFKVTAPVPLAMLISYFLENDYGVSYRKGYIFISSHRAVAAETMITRTYKLQHPWGSISRDSMNGRPYEIRLSLIDTYSKIVLINTRVDGYDDPFNKASWKARTLGAYTETKLKNETGVLYKQLTALQRGMDVSFDEKSSVLTLMAAPSVFDALNTYEFEHTDVASPEESTAAAAEFTRKRMLQIADAADVKPSDRAAVVTLIERLNADELETREQAEKELRTKGLSALKVILGMDPNHTAPEIKDRAGRIAIYIYGEIELSALRARCEAYMKAGNAHDMEAVYRDFWCAKRREEFDQQQSKFDTERGAASRDPALMAALLKHYHFKSGTTGDALSYRAWRADFFSHAPRLESIRLSGDRAAILYTCESVVENAQTGEKQTERFPSSFFMIYENGRWVAADSSTLEDPHPLVWEAEKKDDVAPTDATESDGASAGAWAIAANLGY